MSARAIEVFGWHAPVPGSDRHAGTIRASRLGGTSLPDLSLIDPGEWDWQDRALCAETDPELFFPAKGGAMSPSKRVCGACEVRGECLEYALASYEPWGIWGGLTTPERLAELAAREPGVPRCESGWHPLAGENLTEDGKCLACDEVRAARAERTRRENKGLAA